MKEYGQRYCPIARASEVFAERWTPIIVRNLLLGCATFGDILEGAPGLSRSLLAQRLRDLERHDLVERRSAPGRRGAEYRLTSAGQELGEVCEALGRWGARWLEVAPKQLDPGIVLWAVAKCIDAAALPDKKVVIRFDVRGHPSFWLVVQRPAAELCRTYPGGDEDLVVKTDAEHLARWHMGEYTFRQAVARRLMTTDGPSRWVREVDSWGGQTPFGDVKPARVLIPSARVGYRT
jgi:DNA-binding HxlR family transcriptional regulator